MDFHPLIVHFPIALLTLFAVLEILPLERWYARMSWKEIRFALLSFGVISIVPTIIFGLLAEDGVEGNPLVGKHEFFGFLSLAIFGVLLLVRLSAWFGLPGVFARIARWDSSRPFMVTFSLLGLLSLFITGAFGAAMVYGPGIDPFVRLIVRLLG
jgi:uncharacterized membrane protein